MYICQIKAALKFRLSTVSLTIITLSFFAQACGPVQSHSTIAKAHIAIEAAEGARADRLAIFEYESAKLYLRKAKLEEGLSSFKSAIEFARAAREYADSARARAIENAQARPLTPTERRRMIMQQGKNQVKNTPKVGQPMRTQPTSSTQTIPAMPAMPTMPTMPTMPSSTPNSSPAGDR